MHDFYIDQKMNELDILKKKIDESAGDSKKRWEKVWYTTVDETAKIIKASKKFKKGNKL